MYGGDCVTLLVRRRKAKPKQGKCRGDYGRLLPVASYCSNKQQSIQIVNGYTDIGFIIVVCVCVCVCVSMASLVDTIVFAGLT